MRTVTSARTSPIAAVESTTSQASAPNSAGFQCRRAEAERGQRGTRPRASEAGGEALHQVAAEGDLLRGGLQQQAGSGERQPGRPGGERSCAAEATAREERAESSVTSAMAAAGGEVGAAEAAGAEQGHRPAALQQPGCGSDPGGEAGEAREVGEQESRGPGRPAGGRRAKRGRGCRRTRRRPRRARRQEAPEGGPGARRADEGLEAGPPEGGGGGGRGRTSRSGGCRYNNVMMCHTRPRFGGRAAPRSLGTARRGRARRRQGGGDGHQPGGRGSRGPRSRRGGRGRCRRARRGRRPSGGGCPRGRPPGAAGTAWLLLKSTARTRSGSTSSRSMRPRIGRRRARRAARRRRPRRGCRRRRGRRAPASSRIAAASASSAPGRGRPAAGGRRGPRARRRGGRAGARAGGGRRCRGPWPPPRSKAGRARPGRTCGAAEAGRRERRAGAAPARGAGRRAQAGRGGGAARGAARRGRGRGGPVVESDEDLAVAGRARGRAPRPRSASRDEARASSRRWARRGAGAADDEPGPGAGERDVEEAAALLADQRAAGVLGGGEGGGRHVGANLPDRPGPSASRRICGGLRAVLAGGGVGQDDDRRLEPLGAVHGHHPDLVGGLVGAALHRRPRRGRTRRESR